MDKSGVRSVIDRTLGPRGTLLAFSYERHQNSKFGYDRTCPAQAQRGKTSHSSESGKTYKFNVASRMNSLMLMCLKATGQLNPGDCIDLDFDHQFILAGKKDAEYSYKKAFGYFPGVASVGGLIVGIENRDGNTNVKFHQKDTLERILPVRTRGFVPDCRTS